MQRLLPVVQLLIGQVRLHYGKGGGHHEQLVGSGSGLFPWILDPLSCWLLLTDAPVAYTDR